jgi:hypothetical protein
VSRGVRGNALVKASERHRKKRLYLFGVKGNIPLYVKMRLADHLGSLNTLEREIVRTDSRAPPKRQKWLPGLRSGSPGVLAEAAHKTGRAKADFELREISREALLLLCI